MPIEVTDILPEGAEGASAAAEEGAPPEEEVPPEATPEEAAPAPAPKKRGRPVGSKNKPKAASEVVSEVSEVTSEVISEVSEVIGEASGAKAKAKAKAKTALRAAAEPPAAAPAASVRSASGAPLGGVKRAAAKRIPKAPPIYESESEEETPLSPMSQRRAQWAAYRQAQVDAHQARTAHYSKALDRMLAF